MTDFSAREAKALEETIKDRATVKTLRNLALHLRRGTISGPENVSNATAKGLRSVVSAARFGNLDELIAIIKAAGAFLQDAQPKEQTIGNITRRTLHLLREEARAANIDTDKTPSASLAASQASTSNTPSASTTTLFTAPGSAFTSPPHSRLPSLNVDAGSGSAHASPPASSLSPSAEIGGRPGLSAFRPGSTFSISDLVAAGASSSTAPSSFGASPVGSGTATPAAWGNTSLDRLGYGVESLQIHSQLSNAVEEDESDEASGDESEIDDTRAGTKKRIGANAGIYQLKPLLIQAIQELIDELETVDSSIARDARDHVHSGEVIFTIGYSRTVEQFLKAAAKDRRFTVIVAETAPSFSGHKLARALSSAGISTLLVPDSSTFALMPRISKILLGAHCILANGGMLTTAGARMVAEAAKAHSTPTVVLAGVYKVCPDWKWVGIGTSLVNGQGGSAAVTTSDEGGLDTFKMPSVQDSSEGVKPMATIAPWAGFSSEDSPLDVIDLVEANDAEVVNSTWDYLDPHMIDLLITNVGEHPVSLVYRLLSENYNAEDLVL
jgi:translation initiation factor eIF-2B subunit beta